MLTALLDVIAPPRCVACGAPDRRLWCPHCDREAAVQRLPAAPVTALDVPTTPGVALDAALAVFAYRGVVARSVVAAKLGGAHAAWTPFGIRLAAVVRAAAPTVDVVVPVPTEPRRRRARGFSHTDLLARPVAGALGVPLVARAIRATPGTPDRGAGGTDWDGADAFRARRRLDHARVLLVDDVVTTGATAAAAIGALGRAGARSVVVAVLARAGHGTGG